MSTAVVYYYGEPDDIATASGSDSGERSPAQLAEPVIQLMLTEKLADAGMVMDRDGSITRAPWKDAYAKLQEGLADPPPQIADLPDHIVDQMVVQKMFHYSDILVDNSDSIERDALVTKFLDVLVVNSYPDPTIVARMLASVDSSLDDERVDEMASRALAARHPYPPGAQSTPALRGAYDEAVRTLEALAADH